MKKREMMILAAFCTLFLALPFVAEAADWPTVASDLSDPSRSYRYTLAAGDSLVIPGTATDNLPYGVLVVQGECTIESGADITLKTLENRGFTRMRQTAELTIETVEQYGTFVMNGYLNYPDGVLYQDAIKHYPGSVMFGLGSPRNGLGPVSFGAYNVSLAGGTVAEIGNYSTFPVEYPDINTSIPAILTPTRAGYYFAGWDIYKAPVGSGSSHGITALWSSTPLAASSLPKTGDSFPLEWLGGGVVLLLGAALFLYQKKIRTR